MANIKKNFNFRNGVQVDDDNLLVTTTGLVGIGTTVPTESLDVRGNVKVIGDFTATNSVVGVLTITEASPTRIIGAGVSIQSGIVTAQGTGIVTFFGDARFLQGMPTSQWEDTNAGLGVSSIYNTGGTVGIGTTSPQFTLQIGGNTNPEIGVGISSSGDIKATGIVTASTFSGNVVGNVSGNITGNVTGNLNSLGVSTVADLRVTDLDVDGHTNLDNVNISGLTTFINSNNTAGMRARTFATTSGIAVGELRVLKSPDNTISTGGPMIQLFTDDTPAPLNGPGNNDTISFFTSLFAGQFVQDGSLQLNKNFNVAGVTTLTGITSFFGDVFFPEKIEGSAGFERMNGIKYNSSGASLEFNGFADATFGADDTFGRHLRLFSTTGGGGTLSKTAGSFTIIRALNTSLGIQCGMSSEITLGGHGLDATLMRLSPVGAGIVTIRNANIPQQLTALNANITGIVTAAELNAPSIGVGTITPANDIHVRKSGNAEIQVTSDTGIAGITVGRESGTSNGSNAEIRFGSESGVGAPYSSSGTTLDIINHSTGNFNYYLSANNPGGSQGDFHWLKGFNSDNLMTLTGGGALGIGITLPTAKLHVVGGGKITGNLEVTNNINLGGNFAGNVTGNLIGDVTGNVTGNLTGLINSPVSGVSTITNLEISNVGIGTSVNGKIVNISSNPNQKIIINNDSQVGIFTDTFDDDNVGVAINRNLHIKKAVSVGNTTRSAVDFSDAVNISNEGETGLPFNRSQLAYMIPPRVTTAQRNLLRDAYNNSATLISGAMVYVTDLAGGPKLQVWNGSAWETITSS